MNEKEILRDKIMAMFLLIACGDALGMPVEVLTKKEIEERFGFIRDYLPARPDHKWCKSFVKGQWTDDTQLTLAIARAYIEKKEFTIEQIFLEHVKEMDRSIAGWGGSTIKSLQKIQKEYPNCDIAGFGNPTGAGNGIAMKIAPVGAVIIVEAYFDRLSLNMEELNQHSIERSRHFINCMTGIALMTHRTRMGIASGFAQVAAIMTCFEAGDYISFEDEFFLMTIGSSKSGESFLLNDNMTDEISNRLILLQQNDAYKKMSVDQLLLLTNGATCYAYNSLPFTYAMFLRNPTSIDTLFDVISAGGDTDSNGSMVGALLGAYNGTKIIPKYLLDGLWKREEVENVAKQFCDALGL